MNYDLHKHMVCLSPPRATLHDLARFHAPEYVQFLKRITPLNADQYEGLFHRFNIGEDWCGIFAKNYLTTICLLVWKSNLILPNAIRFVMVLVRKWSVWENLLIFRSLYIHKTRKIPLNGNWGNKKPFIFWVSLCAFFTLSILKRCCVQICWLRLSGIMSKIEF